MTDQTDGGARSRAVPKTGDTGQLRLYVWPRHQSDWTDGVAFALAHDEAEARRLIREHPDNYQEPEGEPIVTDQPFGFARSGGG